MHPLWTEQIPQRRRYAGKSSCEGHAPGGDLSALLMADRDVFSLMLTRLLTMKLTDITEQKSEDKMKYKITFEELTALPAWQRQEPRFWRCRSQQE